MDIVDDMMLNIRKQELESQQKDPVELSEDLDSDNLITDS